MTSEIENLRSILEKATTFLRETSETISRLQIDLSLRDKTVSLMQRQLEEQLHELSMHKKQRQTSSTLLAKLHRLSITSETLLEELAPENARFLQQVDDQRKESKRDLSTIKFVNVADLKLPFAGDIGKRCERAMGLPQYSASAARPERAWAARRRVRQGALRAPVSVRPATAVA